MDVLHKPFEDVHVAVDRYVEVLEAAVLREVRPEIAHLAQQSIAARDEVAGRVVRLVIDVDDNLVARSDGPRRAPAAAQG